MKNRLFLVLILIVSNLVASYELPCTEYTKDEKKRKMAEEAMYEFKLYRCSDKSIADELNEDSPCDLAKRLYNYTCQLATFNDSYEKAGYPDMWKLHYQGGPIGYNVREYSWTSDNDRVFYDNQAIAWNPTITGVKSEDTFISMNGNIEFISYKKDKSWPFFEHNIYGHKIFRPSILIK